MWFYFALFFAIWSAFSTLLVKKELIRAIAPLPLTFILLGTSLVPMFILLQFTGGIPHATNMFYLFMFCSAVLDSVGFVISFKAIKITDISLLAPISSFGPVFTTIFAIYALNEQPSSLKLFGILLIVLGSYLLNVSTIRGGLLAPFKKLFSNRGVLLFLFSNLLWTVTPIFQKKAISEMSPSIPLYAPFIGFCFVVLILAPFALKKTLSYIKVFPKYFKWVAVNGIGTAFAQFAAYTAFALGDVIYVNPVLKLTGIFTIILGGAVLKEKNIGERLLGTAVMLVGVLILIL